MFGEQKQKQKQQQQPVTASVKKLIYGKACDIYIDKLKKKI